VVPYRHGTTAYGASGRVTLHDGRVFDVDQERRDGRGRRGAGRGRGPAAALAGGAADHRRSTASFASATAAALRDAFEAFELLAADGSVADAVEQLVYDPAGLVSNTLGEAVRRTKLAAGGRTLLAAGAVATSDDPRPSASSPTRSP
jgi:hypothetical protein